MAIKIYKLTNTPNVTAADYNTCLTDAGGDQVAAMVLMSDVVLLPNAKAATNSTRDEMLLCSHLAALCHNQGGTLAVNGSDIEITIDEDYATNLVTDGWLAEVV